MLFHLPYTKMGLKSLRLALQEQPEDLTQKLLARFEESRVYNMQVGNLYTGSLYLSLLSLLDNSKTLKAGDRIGLFSYGSGAQGEFFTGLLQPGYQDCLQATDNQEFLQQRIEVSVQEYEELFSYYQLIKQMLA